MGQVGVFRAPPNFFSGRLRFVFPLALILLVRTIYALLIYLQLSAGGTLKLAFMEVAKPDGIPTFLYLFSAWDTGHYFVISQSGYPSSLSPLWAFFPLYPFTITALERMGVQPLLGAWLIASISGLACIPVFQSVAEAYLPINHAFTATVLYFLLPPVLLFSGVSYSEPVFLLLSLVTWQYHLSGRELKANLAAALGSVTRSYGILILLPLAYDYLRKRQLRNLVYIVIPILSFMGWLLYAFIKTGDLLAPLDARSSYWHDLASVTILNAFTRLTRGDLGSLSVLQGYWRIILEGLAFIVFILFLSYRSGRLDRALGAYALVSVAAILFFGFLTSPFSFTRYFTFLFPVGLALYTRKRWLILLAIPIFLVLDYLTWLGFLIDSFA